MDLQYFVLLAHRNSYANSDAKKADSSRIGSSDYHFEEGEFAYHDTYFGSSDFIGEEVVYKSQIPIWGMNYYGAPMSQSVGYQDLYKFLKTALMQEPWPELAVRGPQSFSENGLTYRMGNMIGNFERFSVREYIYDERSDLQYECFLQGGLIK